jgi:hypothetical protein
MAGHKNPFIEWGTTANLLISRHPEQTPQPVANEKDSAQTYGQEQYCASFEASFQVPNACRPQSSPGRLVDYRQPVERRMCQRSQAIVTKTLCLDLDIAGRAAG